MADARTVYQFSPGLHPPGKVRFHLPGRHGTEAEHRGHERYVARTACGLVVYSGWALDVDPSTVVGWPPADVREQTPAAYTRRDHAELLGPLCHKCEAATDGPGCR